MWLAAWEAAHQWQVAGTRDHDADRLKLAVNRGIAPLLPWATK